MPTELIGVKVDTEVKDRILKLVDDGKYRTLSDFLHRAIGAELIRAESGIRPEDEIRALNERFEALARIQAEQEAKFKILESRLQE